LFYGAVFNSPSESWREILTASKESSEKEQKASISGHISIVDVIFSSDEIPRGEKKITQKTRMLGLKFS